MRSASSDVSALVTLVGLVAINGYNMDLFHRTGDVLAHAWIIAVGLVAVAELLAVLEVRSGWNRTRTAMQSRTGQAIRDQRLMGALSLWIGGTAFVVQTAVVLVPLPSSVVIIALALIGGGACVLALVLGLGRPRRTNLP